MSDSLSRFNQNILDTKALATVHSYLADNVRASVSFSDLLRAQIVYAVSAFDKLLHDLVREGIMQIYSGAKAPTPKYLSESIPLSIVRQLNAAPAPADGCVIFEGYIIQKLKVMSFQDPDKISNGLSYIWDERNKWLCIGTEAGINHETLKTNIKLIVARRNSIVHEADLDPISHDKYPIDQADCNHALDVIERAGKAIHRVVT